MVDKKKMKSRSFLRKLLKVALYFFIAWILILIFGETGRVFVDGENSTKWHPAFGGGVWLSIIGRTLNTSITVGISPERTTFYLIARIGL